MHDKMNHAKTTFLMFSHNTKHFDGLTKLSFSVCEVFYLTRGLQVISNFWRCSRSLVIKMVQKLFKKISNKRKIKEILFKYLITKLPSNGYFLNIFYNVNLPKDCFFKQNQ